MNTPAFHNRRSRLGNRVAVVLAGSIGFAIGGVTLAGALGGDDSPATAATEESIFVPDTAPVESTIPDSTTPDSSVPDSSVPTNPLPGQFTKTYDSAGGSITVTWSGTAFSLDAVNAAAGHDVEIEDQRWDRIRVEFRGDTDSRIEVRLSDDDNTIRVRID